VDEITELETTVGRTTNGGPDITTLHHCGPHTVQVHVARDFYERQSCAVASVLTPELTWTVLCHEPTSIWFPTTRDLVDLLAIANDLRERACRILRVPTA
jgi:accessory colonization factor AcfC